MSGIPEDEIKNQVENLKCTLDKCPNKEGEEIWRDAVRWAERFYWDARVTEPEAGEAYHIWNGHYWEMAIYRVIQQEGLVFWATRTNGWGYSLKQAPYYKPIPPAPEDEQS